MYNILMNRNKLKEILSNDGYEIDMINSILVGRRKPNSNKRYEYEQKHSIPFTAWEDIKSYLQNNNTTNNSNKAIINE